MLAQIVQGMVDSLVVFATDLLIPMMAIAFVFAVGSKFLIYLTIRREHWFSEEFEKRTQAFMDALPHDSKLSFYVAAKMLLEKTYYELFEIRAIMKRRRLDFVATLSDRVFLIQQGVARLVISTLKQVKYLRVGGEHPKFLEISKHVFENNPCFNRVFGIIPAAGFNDILNILPGIFIIGGIFGTFLGIMKALPELGGMDLNDIEGTKMVMDEFLLKISFAMSTSIVGIVFSTLLTFINTILSPERLFLSLVTRYENALDSLWVRSENNLLPADIPDFDEHRDPIEALAEQALYKQLAKDNLSYPTGRTHGVAQGNSFEGQKAPNSQKDAS